MQHVVVRLSARLMSDTSQEHALKILRRILHTHADAVVWEVSEKSTLPSYVSHVTARHIERMSCKSPRPFPSALAGRLTIDVKFLMHVHLFFCERIVSW